MAKWKRDSLYSIVLLVLCAVNFGIANNIEDGNIQYALGSPNNYLKLWLLVLALLSIALLVRSLKKRPAEETTKIWDRLTLLTVGGSILYILTVKQLGFFITTFLLVSMLAVVYGTEAKGRKRGKDLLLQNGKFVLFALVLTIVTEWVFRSFLAVKLPTFSLF